MATYNEKVIQSHASTVFGRCVVLVMFYTVMFGFTYYTIHRINVRFIHYETATTNGKIIGDPYRQEQSLNYGLTLWPLVGLCVGMMKAGKYRADSELALCMVEQEKHLKLIAERLTKSD